MTKFNPTAILGFAAAGMLASAVPATAAPMFDTAKPAKISAAEEMSANQYRNRDRYRTGNRNYYNGNNVYTGPAWRGRDGRYYCRRGDGTTGLLIGGAVGGVLGHTIAGGGDRTIGTILGVAGGALLGREIDRSSSSRRCR